jgi:ABC-2 type transport system permease protein
MKSWYALVHREFLEHRGAFVYAPAVLTIVLLGALIVAAFSSDINIDTGNFVPPAAMLYEGPLLVAVVLWTSYLMISLFFYFADSFSADRRDNAMLFWRSMPQSDLKILASKMLAGATIFPLLIFGWLILSSAIAYVATIVLAARFPAFVAPDLVTALGSWFQITIASIVFIVLLLLWYAPFFAWVAGLSTVFRRWSIPLAFVIPAGIIGVEMIVTYSGGAPNSEIEEFLAWRMTVFFAEDDLAPMLLTGEPVSAARMITDMIAVVDWPALFSGLVFAGLATWAASEYRRRKNNT